MEKESDDGDVSSSALYQTGRGDGQYVDSLSEEIDCLELAVGRD